MYFEGERILNSIKEVLFMTIYAILALILTYKVNLETEAEKTKEEKFIGIIITSIGLMLLGAGCYYVLFN